MNILPIINYNTFNRLDRVQEKTNVSNFGLKISQPLTQDTISFKSKTSKATKKLADKVLEQTNKNIGSYENSARIRDVKDKILKVKQGHKDLKNKILRIYKNDISEDVRTEGRSITLSSRVKSDDSLKAKSTSIDLNEISDTSGFAFILEDTSAFNKFSTHFIELLKHGYTVVDYEYHRLPTKYSRGKIERTFDSINPSSQQKFKTQILKYCPKMEGKMLERDSKAGYSALHMLIRDKNGIDHEVQVYIRAIADVKKVENLVYKLKSGKEINKKYLKVSPHLTLLKPPKKGEQLTPLAKAVQEEMKGYSMDAYIDALSHPYTPNKILKPNLKKYPHLKDFDFNNLLYLFELPV